MHLHLGNDRSVPTLATTVTNSEYARLQTAPGFLRTYESLEAKHDIRVIQHADAVTMQFLLKRIGRRPASRINNYLRPVIDMVDWLTIVKHDEQTGLQIYDLVTEPSPFDGQLRLRADIGWPRGNVEDTADFATGVMRALGKQIGYVRDEASTYARLNEGDGAVLMIDRAIRVGLETPEHSAYPNLRRCMVEAHNVTTPQEMIVGLAGAIAVAQADELLAC